MSDVKQRAREALEGITPGPWMVESGSYSEYGVYAEDGLPGTAYVAEQVSQGQPDAKFIAAAPDLVRDLLAALEVAEARAADAEYGERTYRTVREELDTSIAERDEARELRHEDLKYCERLTVENERLRGQVERAREFLPTLRNLPEIYRHLVMDTPEDQATHTRATEVADQAIDAMDTVLRGDSGE